MHLGSQTALFENQRRARSEAITSSLRKFGRVDDFGLCDLFREPILPHFDQVVRLIHTGMTTPVPGVSADYIAQFVYSAVAACEQQISVKVAGQQVDMAVRTIHSVDDLVAMIELCLGRFQFLVRENKGHKLIQGEEERAQIFFDIFTRDVAIAHGVDWSREVETGRGPVDFKASSGARARVMIELKRASNSEFWNGIRHQVPTYLKAGEIQYGYFVPILQDGDDDNLVNGINTIASDLSEQQGLQIRVYTIDGRTPPSASKIKK